MREKGKRVGMGEEKRGGGEGREKDGEEREVKGGVL